MNDTRAALKAKASFPLPPLLLLLAGCEEFFLGVGARVNLLRAQEYIEIFLIQ